jgi:hypothetical protein
LKFLTPKRSVSISLRSLSAGSHTCRNTRISVRSQQLHQLYRTSDTSDTDTHIDYINNKTMTDAVSDNTIVKNRFKEFLSLFRFAGMPINMKSTSRVNTVYNATILVCFYITATCLLMDCFVHRHDLTLFMKKFRILIGTLLFVWMHISIRYASPYSVSIKYNFVIIGQVDVNPRNVGPLSPRHGASSGRGWR